MVRQKKRDALDRGRGTATERWMLMDSIGDYPKHEQDCSKNVSDQPQVLPRMFGIGLNIVRVGTLVSLNKPEDRDN
jgi:hypothetical protein